MTPEEFKAKQAALGWTNGRMARHLRKTAQSISNYRNGRQKIPEHVDVLLQLVLKEMRDAPVKRRLTVNPDIGRT